MKRFFAVLSLCLLWSTSSRAQVSFAPLAKKVIPSTVNISTQLRENQDAPEVINKLMFATNDGRLALGSGFIVGEDGYIVTNRHVIEQGQNISVITADDTVYQAQIIGVDKHTDLALLKITPKSSLAAVKFGDSDELEIGDWVLTVGNPFGLGSSVSAGIISAKSRNIGDDAYDEYLQTDAAINQGNSGGPMFDTQGRLVGINTAIFSDSGINAGVGFALPSNEAEWVITQLMENGRVKRSWLGIEVKNGETSDGINGLLITAIADDVGKDWQVGDVIVKVNDINVGSVKTFSRKISHLPVGTTVKFKFRRDGQTHEQEVTTRLMPELQAAEADIRLPKIQIEGKFYPEFGMTLDAETVTDIVPNGQAAQKGMKAGDKLIKVNGQAVIDAENLSYYFNEALNNGNALRLDIISPDNEAYFVELIASMGGDDDAN